MHWKAKALIILSFSSVLIVKRLLPLFGAVFVSFSGLHRRMWVVTGVSNVKADVNADITCGSLLKNRFKQTDGKN